MLTDLENEIMTTSGEVWRGGIVRELGIDMYIPGFSGGASGKEPACQCRRCKRVGLDPQVRKIWMKGMATHSSILVWRITWTEEPGMLQSMGSQSIGHHLATEQSC